MTFIGNHDVTRIASQLEDPRHVAHALVLLLTTGGTPSIYAGDEWAYRGVKEERFGGDDAVRPEFPARPEDAEHLGAGHLPPAPAPDRSSAQASVAAHRAHHGTALANSQYVYRTGSDSAALVVALNLDDAPLRTPLSDIGFGSARILAGSGAPAENVVDALDVEPHGWAILAP